MRRTIVICLGFLISLIGFSTLVKAETAPAPIFDLNLDNYNLERGQGAINESTVESDVKVVIHRAPDTSYATLD